MRSAALTLPGFTHDTCSGFFPLTAASPAFRDLDLDLDWVDPPIPMVHVLDDAGAEVALHRDLAATIDSLEACTPGAGVAVTVTIALFSLITGAPMTRSRNSACCAPMNGLKSSMGAASSPTPAALVETNPRSRSE